MSADARSFYDGRICQCFTAGRFRQDTVGYAFPWGIGTVSYTHLFNRKEAQDLAAKAKKACLSEAGLIRLLIRGYEPKEKPDDRFYDVMRELSSIGNNINQLAAKANTLGFIDAPMLKNEAAKWNKFQSEIERTYLRPNQSEMKWQ